jgi:hypothetical protein
MYSLIFVLKYSNRRHGVKVAYLCPRSRLGLEEARIIWCGVESSLEFLSKEETLVRVRVSSFLAFYLFALCNTRMEVMSRSSLEAILSLFLTGGYLFLVFITGSRRIAK